MTSECGISDFETSKCAQFHRCPSEAQNPLLCLVLKGSTGLQRAPICPGNTWAAGETGQWAPSTPQNLLADSKTGKLGVDFIIDSFLMGEEAETEPVT